MISFAKTLALLLLVGLMGIPFLLRRPEKQFGLILEPGDSEWAELNDGRVPLPTTRLETRIEETPMSENEAVLRRNTKWEAGKEFEGEWVVVPLEDFNEARDLFAELEQRPTWDEVRDALVWAQRGLYGKRYTANEREAEVAANIISEMQKRRAGISALRGNDDG